MTKQKAFRRLALTAVLALICQACAQGPSPAGPELRVDGGELPAGSWTAWAFQSADSGLCLQIRIESGDSSSLCGLSGDGTWRPDTPSGVFLGGTTGDERAASVRLALANGSELKATVVREAGMSSLGFFVMPIPAGHLPTGLDLLDHDGMVIGSVPLDQ